MRERDIEYQELFKELSNYEKNGVRIIMDGSPASPMQVISAHLVQEENTYMRDYVVDEEGKLTELCFQHVKKDQ